MPLNKETKPMAFVVWKLEYANWSATDTTDVTSRGNGQSKTVVESKFLAFSDY